MKHPQPPCSDLGQFGGTLGTSRNYSRVVHLGWEVRLGNQMSAEIKVRKKGPNHAKVKDL